MPQDERLAPNTENDADLQRIYSQACTRSGIAILILVGISCLVFARAAEYETYGAALHVAIAGKQLQAGVSNALADDCWPPLEKEKLEVTLTELYRTQCLSDGAPKLLTLEERQQAGRVALVGRTEIIAPASESTPEPQLRFESYNHAVAGIVGALQAFDDEARIAQAHRFSLDVEYRLQEWLALMSRIQMSKWHDGLPSDDDVWEITMGEAKRLADAFPIDLAEMEALASRYHMGVPNLYVSATLRQTAEVVLISLLIFTLYFWINLNVASKLPSFPAPGTLFYIFGSTWISRTALDVMLLSPVAASFLLLFKPLENSWFGFLPSAAIIVLAMDSGSRVGEKAKTSQG